MADHITNENTTHTETNGSMTVKTEHDESLNDEEAKSDVPFMLESGENQSPSQLLQTVHSQITASPIPISHGTERMRYDSSPSLARNLPTTPNPKSSISMPITHHLTKSPSASSSLTRTPQSVRTPQSMRSHQPMRVAQPMRTPQMTVQQRRSSTRSIKRKKFDDELVESSLIKSDRARMKVPLPFVPEKIEPIILQEPPPVPPPAPVPEKKRHVKSTNSKRVKRQKVAGPTSTKDLGRWKAQDDLALITAIQQTSDLTAVHLGVKFSCKFTLKEIQERWYSLMYDPVISKLAVLALKQLHPDMIANVQAKALYSKDEEHLLAEIKSTSQPNLEVFQELLNQQSDIFYPARNAKALHSHWLLMKQYHLLPDQSVQPMPRGDHVLNFSDAEDLMNDDDVKEPKDELIDNEMAISDRRNKREIRHLEQELPKWQVLVDSVTGISPPDFDNQTLAVLRGRLVRYLMRSKEITLGRATKDNQIDVDLSLEGPAWKISRRQGVIKLRNNGDFFIANEGKRPVYIDGKPVLAGNKQRLNNHTVVEISSLRFIFLINQELINVIRNEAQKMTTAL